MKSSRNLHDHCFKNRLLVTFSLVCALIFGSCTTKNATVECGEVTYISTFPENVHLESLRPLKLYGMEGMVDFKADDSIIVGIFQQSPFLKIYSMNSAAPLGEFINKGQGPDDFTAMPSNISVRRSPTASVVSMLDYRKNRYFEMNAEASVKAQHEVYDTVIESPSFKGVRYIIPINNGDTLFWDDNYWTKSFNRRMGSGSETRSISNLGNLEADWSEYEDNMLSMLVAYNHESGIVAEAMTHLNQINLFSLSDSTIRKTICVGDKLSNVAEEDGYGRRKRLIAYQGIQPVKDMFALLYVGMREADYIKAEHGTQLQFFSSAGEPLLCVSIPLPVNSFFIDSTGRLYLFSSMEETETMYTCDIEEVKRLLTITI